TSKQLQREVFKEIKAHLKRARHLARLAQWLLLETLLLNQRNHSIKTLKQSLGSSGRLDAEFYQEKYERTEAFLRRFATIKLKDLVDTPISSGATPKAGGTDYTDAKKGVAFIRVQDLQQGRVCADKTLFITPTTHHTTLKRTQLKKGDVLFSIAGVIGRCALFNHDFEANINQALCILRFFTSKGIHPLYLVAFFNSPIGQAYLAKYARQGLQTNLNLQEVGELQIPKIPTPIQEKIANKLQESFNSNQQAKQLLTQAKLEVEEVLRGVKKC
ncbi:restriction endonuclease subunit S, partial [Helicobacter ailurogastricus]|uniref:restriction endonuclease subunit S n=1 Tax=Helicobacter ailurogastricus TaxID=1578720 RepID=UPI002554A198